MSVSTTEGQEGALDLPTEGDSLFASIMDAMVPDEADASAGAGTPTAGTDAGAAGQPAAPAQGAGGAGAAAPAPAAGAGGDQPVAPAGGAVAPAAGATGGADGAAGDGSAVGVDFAVVAPEFGKLSTALEEGALQIHQQTALAAVQKEQPRYFDAIRKHPRLLVGMEVPAIGKEGTEILRDTQDAKDWQDAVKQLLVEEVQDRAQRAMESDSEMLTTVHQSIELFQNNADLVPGTKQFDSELAAAFVKLAKPYELRVEGKLHGYSIPVQPLVNQVRADLAAKRAAAATPPPAAPAAAGAAGAAQGAGAAAAPAPASAAPPAAPAPQAGIPAHAGTIAEQEDFSVLFGTIGLPTLRI